MESSTISSHVGPEVFIEEFSLNSSSPEARRLNEELLIGDPFGFNIELKEDCISQSADIVQAFLKVLGEKLCFSKVKKFKLAPAIRVIAQQQPIRPKEIVFQVPDEIRKTRDLSTPISDEERKAVEEFRNQQHTIELEKEGKPLKQIVNVDIGVQEHREALEKYKATLRSIGVDPRHVIRY